MIKLSQPTIPESAIERVADILRSGQLVHGAECDAFETELAVYLGVKHALVVSNGTAALHLALLACEIGPGDAVIVPDFTFAATANIVEMTGAKAIIADVEASSYNLDVAELEKCIKSWDGPEKLKAIMPVLEFGNPKNLQEYRRIADKYNLTLIEDAACALGAYDGDVKVGTAGDFGCFSFHPRKTLTTGEGGALVTNNTALYNQAKLLRSHGMIRSEDGIKFECIGLNYRLTNFQAAIGRALLPNLNSWIDKRRALAAFYQEGLQPLEKQGLIKLPVIGEGHSLQTYMLVLAEQFDRSTIIKKLKEVGIESSLGAQSMSALGLYDHVNNSNSRFLVGNNLYSKGLAIPLHEGLTSEDCELVINVLNKILYK